MTDAEAEMVAFLLNELHTHNARLTRACEALNAVCTTHHFWLARDGDIGTVTWRVVTDEDQYASSKKSARARPRRRQARRHHAND